MKCREFENRLNDLLDDRKRPEGDALLADHARDCEPCGQLLAGQQLLLAGIKRASLPATTSGFARRVVEQASPAIQVARRAPSSQRNWWAVGTLLTAAAAMLLILSLVWQARQGAIPVGNDQALTDPQEIDNYPPDYRPAVRPENRSRPPGLALAQADWLIEAPRLPATLREYSGTFDNLAITLPETVQRLDEMEHYAPGIKPIRISFGVLLDTLWNAFPGSSNAAQQPASTTYRRLDPRHVA